jgi:Protein of unknown function (DUF3224)
MPTVPALALCCAMALAGVASAGSHMQTKEDAIMKQTATGPFDVKLDALQTYNQADPSMGRRSIDKRFHGELDATSKGEMLSVGTARDNGGYVAIERVTGTLAGRSGSFALQHNATMTAGVPYLNIVVVPGSGTGELSGLSGSMNIDIAPGGAHSYRFDYSLPPAAQ